MKLYLFTAIAALFLASCAGPPIIDENCILAPVVREGQVYYVGPCFDAEGEVESMKVRWSNEEGVKFRAVVSSKSVTITYLSQPDPTQPGMWIEWSSKTGLMLGQVPPEVRDALVVDGEK